VKRKGNVKGRLWGKKRGRKREKERKEWPKKGEDDSCFPSLERGERGKNSLGEKREEQMSLSQNVKKGVKKSNEKKEEGKGKKSW